MSKFEMPNFEGPESKTPQETAKKDWEGSYRGFKVRLIDPPYEGSCPTEMSGSLNGHEIEVSWRGYSYSHGVGGLEMTVDGKKLSKENAEAIWAKQKSNLLGVQLEAHEDWRKQRQKQYSKGQAERLQERDEKWKAEGVSDIMKDLAQG